MFKLGLEKAKELEIKSSTFAASQRIWWFQIGQGVRQGYILSPFLFNLYAEYIMRNAGLGEAQAGIEIATSDVQMTPPLWQKVKN